MQVPIKQRITELVLSHLEGLDKSDRGRAKKVGISHSLINKFRDGTAMGIDTLEKIVDTIPELRVEIARVFMDEKQEDAGHIDDLRLEIRHLRKLSSEQSEAILNFSRQFKASNADE